MKPSIRYIFAAVVWGLYMTNSITTFLPLVRNAIQRRATFYVLSINLAFFFTMTLAAVLPLFNHYRRKNFRQFVFILHHLSNAAWVLTRCELSRAPLRPVEIILTCHSITFEIFNLCFLFQTKTPLNHFCKLLLFAALQFDLFLLFSLLKDL